MTRKQFLKFYHTVRTWYFINKRLKESNQGRPATEYEERISMKSAAYLRSFDEVVLENYPKNKLKEDFAKSVPVCLS